MYGDFNPRTSQWRDIFSKKTKGLVDNKRFDVTTKDAGAIHKFLIGNGRKWISVDVTLHIQPKKVNPLTVVCNP